MSTDGTVADVVASHPRIIGGLFAVGLVLLQAGSVVASETASINGP